MIGGIVRQQIARTNRNLLVSNAVLLALILLYAAVASLATGQNLFFLTRPTLPASQSDKAIAPADMSHPTAITVHDLDSEVRLKQLQGHAVRLTDPDAVDLAFPVWNASQRGAIENPSQQPNYRFSKRGDHLLVILPPNSATKGPGFTGILRRLDEQDGSQVTTVLHSRGIQNFTLLPVMLDGFSHEKGPGPRATMPALPSMPTPNLLLVLLMAVPVWNVFKAIQRGRNPGTHPLVRSLEKYGPIEDVSRAIDADSTAGITRITPAQFSPNWLLVPTFYTCIAMPLDALVWIYERVYITRGRSYAICLRDRQGGYAEFTCALFQVNKIIAHAVRVRPWILSGYSGQAAVDFASNRAQFIADVDRRRQQHLAASAPAQPYSP